MYNASTLKTELLGLIGWRQNEDATGTQLTALTTSASGLYFNDEHPLLTFDNLLSIAPDYSRLYVDQADINTAFTAWLQQKTEAGIIRAVQMWLDAKFLRRTARNILSRRQLYEVTGRQQDTDNNDGKVVGLEIVPVRSRNVAMKIEQIGLQFDTAGTVTVYLFNAKKAAPEQTQVVAYATAGEVQWQVVNWSLSGDGAYYLVYQQSEAPGRSINGAVDYHYTENELTFIPMGNFFQVTAFEIADNGVASIWDIADNAYNIATNYGLNIRMNVQCDYTEFITEQKDLFKTAIAKCVAIDLLREMAYNPQTRVNRHESNVQRNEILYEIDGDTQGRKGGLRYMLDQALNDIHFDFSDIDPVCLPCRKRGVKYTSV